MFLIHIVHWKKISQDDSRVREILHFRRFVDNFDIYTLHNSKKAIF